jgi:hypothetical protein
MIFYALGLSAIFTPVVASPSTGPTRFDVPCVTIRIKGAAGGTIEIPSLEEEMKARGFDKAHFKHRIVSTSAYYDLDDWSEATCTVEVSPR